MSEPVFSTSSGDEPATSDTTTTDTTTVEPEPEPVTPESLAGKVVAWDGHDEWGNPRRCYGVVLREHEWAPGKVEVHQLHRDYREHDLSDLTVLGS